MIPVVWMVCEHYGSIASALSLAKQTPYICQCWHQVILLELKR
jgi:hypothetical protein